MHRLTHVRSKRPEHYLAAHAFAKDHGLHCSRTFQLECERRCNFATLPPHDGPCAKESSGAPSPSVSRRSTAPVAALILSCTIAMTILSTKSVRWATAQMIASLGPTDGQAPFQPLAQKLLSRRFERKATRKQLRVPGQAWLAVASEARAAYYTKVAKARSLQRPLVSAKPGLKTLFIPGESCSLNGRRSGPGGRLGELSSCAA